MTSILPLGRSIDVAMWTGGNIAKMTIEKEDTMNFEQVDRVRPLVWEDKHLSVLDQRELPHRQIHLACRTSSEVAEAIHVLAVRGAPAIGIAGAFGVVLAAHAVEADTGAQALQRIDAELTALEHARPTAVNLHWAIQRMREKLVDMGADWRDGILRAAQAIQSEDLAANHRMGSFGAECLPDGARVLTHCNTGSLATAGFGTALGVIRAGVASGRITKIYAGLR